MAIVPFELLTALSLGISNVLFYVAIGAIVVVVIDAAILIWMNL